jgi:hypothetical protein
VFRPLAPVPGDPGEEDEVVVATGDLEGVELEGADPVDDPEHALRLSRQGPRWGEEMA